MILPRCFFPEKEAGFGLWETYKIPGKSIASLQGLTKPMQHTAETDLIIAVFFPI